MSDHEIDFEIEALLATPEGQRFVEALDRSNDDPKLKFQAYQAYGDMLWKHNIFSEGRTDNKFYFSSLVDYIRGAGYVNE